MQKHGYCKPHFWHLMERAVTCINFLQLQTLLTENRDIAQKNGFLYHNLVFGTRDQTVNFDFHEVTVWPKKCEL